METDAACQTKELIRNSILRTTLINICTTLPVLLKELLLNLPLIEVNGSKLNASKSAQKQQVQLLIALETMVPPQDAQNLISTEQLSSRLTAFQIKKLQKQFLLKLLH